MRSAILVFTLMLAATTANAQTSVDARTRAIVASFNKSKHVVKSKNGVTVDKYKRIASEPALRSDPSSYSGSYLVDGLGYSLDLRVTRDGHVDGSGEEPIAADPNIRRQFKLSGTMEGALLSGTKTYASGAREKFDGVFINSTTYESPTDKGVTTFGLGVLTPLRDFGGVTTDKLFYQVVR